MKMVRAKSTNGWLRTSEDGKEWDLIDSDMKDEALSDMIKRGPLVDAYMHDMVVIELEFADPAYTVDRGQKTTHPISDGKGGAKVVTSRTLLSLTSHLLAKLEQGMGEEDRPKDWRQVSAALTEGYAKTAVHNAALAVSLVNTLLFSHGALAVTDRDTGDVSTWLRQSSWLYGCRVHDEDGVKCTVKALFEGKLGPMAAVEDDLGVSRCVRAPFLWKLERDEVTFTAPFPGAWLKVYDVSPTFETPQLRRVVLDIEYETRNVTSLLEAGAYDVLWVAGGRMTTQRLTLRQGDAGKMVSDWETSKEIKTA